MHADRLKKKSNIMIFGTGLDAVRCSYKLEKLALHISGYVVSMPKVANFRGGQVLSYEMIRDMDYFYVVATSYSTYPYIAKLLREDGKREFVDFIYYEYIDKKIAFLHGNCHMNVVEKYLNSSIKFREKYVFYHAPRLVMGCELRCENEIFKNIDLWIHQDIRVNNAIDYKASDEYIRSQIGSKNVKEIVVPNLFGLGRCFFPQNRKSIKNEKNDVITVANDIDYSGMFPMPDLIIDECMEHCMEVDEIICYCKSLGIFDTNYVLTMFEAMIKRIEKREKNWDVKILKFIVENYKKQKLFYDPWHPTNVVLEYISKEILKILNMDVEEIKCDYMLDSNEEPVYPDVKSILKLEWTDNEIRKSNGSKKCVSKMDFEEYIREYIWWCSMEMF